MKEIAPTRRDTLLGAAALAVAMITRATAASESVRLVLVHGRGQQLGAEATKDEWMAVLGRGAQALGRHLPNNLEVAFPYYADALDRFNRQFNVPPTSEIKARGGPEQDEFLAFQAELAEALRERAGISDQQVLDEYVPNDMERGPLNWAWVQAILRALDRHGGDMSMKALEAFTRDVFLYTTRRAVRSHIDGIVANALRGTDKPCVVVGHSLGSVVAYSVLRSANPRILRVPLFVTLGSPLAITPIRKQFAPLRNPKPPVDAWLNAFDRRDVVSLYPLDAANFPVTPAIENYGKVNNQTDDRHGVAGYLDDEVVVRRILASLVGWTEFLEQQRDP